MRHFTILCGQITAMNTLLIRVFQTCFNRFVVPSLSQIDKINVRLANGIFWSFIGSITYQGLTLLATIPVARLLGPSGYGELGIIQSTLMTFMVFSGLSLGQTATKYVAELRGRDPERVGRIIGLTSTVGLVISALLGLVLYTTAPYLLAHVLHAPHLSIALRLAALVLIFKGVNGAQLGVLAGYEAFDSIAKINFLSGVLMLPILTIGACLGGVNGAVVSLAVVSFFTVLITEKFVRGVTEQEGIAILYRNSLREWHVLPVFYLPTVLSGLIVLPVTWVANALLVNQAGGYVEMGIFNVANQWRTAMQFLPAIIAQPVLPILSSLYGENAIGDFKRVLRMNLILALTSSFVPAIVIIIAAKWIMQMYGPDFLQGATVLSIMVLTTVFSSTAAVIGTAISSVGKRWHATALNLMWAVTFLVASLLLVSHGAIGLAIAYLTSYILHFCIVGAYALLFLHRILKKTNIPSPLILKEPL
jgi:O-antigen/teichoic acid export membrane protein